jgi:hypothetical protein
VLAGAAGSLIGACGPFSDVAADTFCPFVLEIFTLGITTGTTPATYDPTANVSRLQMAAFLSRTVDGVVKRGSRHAALGRFWLPASSDAVGLATVAGSNPSFVKSDGADVWAASFFSLSRVRASDGKLLGTWTSATQVSQPMVLAFGRVIVAGAANPGKLITVDPTLPPGAVTTVASNLLPFPVGIAFDGARVWVVNSAPPVGVSIVTPSAAIPWTVTTVTTGDGVATGAIFDGASVWITDSQLRRLDASGAIAQSVAVPASSGHPIFDGANIWVPNLSGNSVAVVRASTGVILQTLTGNGLASPVSAAFDGERVLVTNSGADGVSLWKAADLSPLGFVSTGAGSNPYGACSDGVQFWIALNGKSHIARF